jgi:hypothetical protein
MDYQLIMLPLEAGGTCGREDLVLCSVPVEYQGKCSLHLISDNENLDDFWEACVKVSDDE